jgi:virulence-associated protein VapD
VALNISSIQTAAPYSQTNNCGASLAAGQSCTVNVTFSPTAVKYYSASLTIADDATNSPQTVSLTGSGITGVTYSPKLIAFPNQVAGSSSNPSSVTLNNNQSVALNISSIQTSAPFSQTNNCGTSLAAAHSCALNIVFSPTAVKYYSSAVTIADDAGNSPQIISVTGSGFALPVTYSPMNIPFPNQGIGASSSPSSVTLNNNQSVALSISSIQTSAPFSQTNNCGTSLAAGHSCALNIVFSPTAVQYYSSALTITDNAANSPQTVPLTGSGVVGIAFTPLSGGFYFSHQIVNTPSTPQLATITNNQPAALTFSSMTSSADYPFTTNCGTGNGGGTLAPGATCTVQVYFNPQAMGTRTANLIIAESAPGSPLVFSLQGTGIAGAPGPGVNVTPPLPCILPSETEQFNASVTDLSSQAVFWYVDNILNGNSNVGVISASGLYAAPANVGSHLIKAVSQVSSSASGSATLTITLTPSFGIYPYVASIPTGGQQTFQAQICAVPDSGAVSFTVDSILGGNGTVGTVSSTGVYTAPLVAGKHTVKVTDSTLNKTSGGVVTVFSSITADFGSRTYTNYPVPANMFGTALADSIHSVADRELLTQAGLTEARLYAQIPLVYATETPNWSKIDPLISSIQAAGQQVILQMSQSPSWLQPTSGPCAGGNVQAAPTDISQWALIAASYVAHMDSTFPGVVQDYEIWNEPNATGMCAGDHLNTYLAIYAAAAPAMKAQAAQDGKTIRVGGPALSGYSAFWLSPFLTNPKTAPYVDFVSYHQYLFGNTQLQTQWDTYTGNVSLYQGTQDPSNGAFANYNKVLTEVATGNQPLGARTPIYITEFNTNWAFYKDCCRDDPTYAPVWNSLYVTDLLNSIYNGEVKVPSKLIYFAGSQYPWFCMIGVLDSDMDCEYSVGATPVPYPQYYAYQLLASNEYLGLSGGGYMAKTLSAPTGGGGLATTAFYTSTQDAIVITNPTPTAYSQISVTFANPGFSNTQGTLYTIENGAQINSSAISFSVQGTSLTTTISVPAYSVQGISLK